MIGLVVVSHSRPLAEAAIALALEMVPAERRPVVLAAAGLDDGSFGTDAAAVAEAVAGADSGDGVLVLLDLGSAVLSAELSLEFLDPDAAARVRLSPAPLVEGLVAAVVVAAAGASLASCDAEARRGLAPKAGHLGPGEAPASEGRDTPSADMGAVSGHGAAVSTWRVGDGPPESVTFTATIDLPSGLHARPAAAIVAALAPFDVEAVARNLTRGGEADADSAIGLMSLGLARGDELAIALNGPDADAAASALGALAAGQFGEAPA